jgi:antirestriction protein
MAEGKYGRIFTLDDALTLMKEAVAQGVSADDDFRRVITDCEGSLKFPADEPVFLLRGQDASAPDAIEAYAENCAQRDADEAHVKAAEDWAHDMNEWQRDNPQRVKVAD